SAGPHRRGDLGRELGRSGFKQICGSLQNSNFRLSRHVCLSYSAAVLTNAQRAAPSKAIRSLVITLTGIDSSRTCILPLPVKACMNNGPESLDSILGAIPPPRYIPPVAIILSARLPASAPKVETNKSRACSHKEHLPSIPAREIAAAGSDCAISSTSPCGGVPRPVSRRKLKTLTRPGPETIRS